MAKTDFFTFGDEDLEDTGGAISPARSTSAAVRVLDEVGPEGPQAAPAFCSRPRDVGARQGAQRSRDDSEPRSSAKRGLPAHIFKAVLALGILALVVLGFRLLHREGSDSPTSVAIKNSALPRAIASPTAHQARGSRPSVESGPRATARDKQVQRKRSVTRRRAPRRRTPRRQQKRGAARFRSQREGPVESAIPDEREPAPVVPPPAEEVVEPTGSEEVPDPVSSPPAPAPSPSGGQAAQSQFGVESGAGG